MNTPTTDATSNDLLTYEEAAALLGVQRAAIQTAIGNGKLHPVKLPGSVRKYLHRADVESYPARRNAPVMRREQVEAPTPASAPASPSASETLDADKLRELAAALSGPTIEAMRDAQETARQGISGLVQIAVGLAIGTASASGLLPSPKRVTG